MLSSGPKDLLFHYSVDVAVVVSFTLGDGASKYWGLKNKPKMHHSVSYKSSRKISWVFHKYKSIHLSIFFFLFGDSELQKPINLHIVTRKFAFELHIELPFHFLKPQNPYLSFYSKNTIDSGELCLLDWNTRKQTNILVQNRWLLYDSTKMNFL